MTSIDVHAELRDDVSRAVELQLRRGPAPRRRPDDSGGDRYGLTGATARRASGRCGGDLG
jgi:hypothetical protein